VDLLELGMSYRDVLECVVSNLMWSLALFIKLAFLAFCLNFLGMDVVCFIECLEKKNIGCTQSILSIHKSSFSV
jgi:hypothetical protein